MRNDDFTTWRKEFEKVFELTGDSFDGLIATLTPEQLDVEFYSGYGGTEGFPFTAWSKDYVYFPACYDGSEWVACVSRNPDGKPTEHVGGG
jgi:hypothetical protein